MTVQEKRQDIIDSYKCWDIHAECCEACEECANAIAADIDELIKLAKEESKIEENAKLKKKNCQWLQRIISRLDMWRWTREVKHCKKICFFCKYKRECDYHCMWRLNK